MLKKKSTHSKTHKGNQPIEEEPYSSVAPQIENVKPCRQYTFTLNPSDQYQFWDDPLREIMIVHKMAKYISDRANYLNIEVYLETSSVGRLHWHGTIMFVDIEAIKRFYLSDLHALLAKNHVEIDTIGDSDEDHQRWEDYISKQYEFMQIFLHNESAIRHIKNHENIIKNNNLRKVVQPKYFTRLSNES